jgi:hypothetical protein
VHLVRIIVDVRALGDSVKVTKAEVGRELVERAVDVGDGEDAGRVVELVIKTSVPTGGNVECACCKD